MDGPQQLITPQNSVGMYALSRVWAFYFLGLQLPESPDDMVAGHGGWEVGEL